MFEVELVGEYKTSRTQGSSQRACSLVGRQLVMAINKYTLSTLCEPNPYNPAEKLRFTQNRHGTEEEPM